MGNPYMDDDIYYSSQEDIFTCNIIAGFGLAAAIVLLVAAVLTFIFSCCGRLDQQFEQTDTAAPITVFNDHKVNVFNTNKKETAAGNDMEEEEISEHIEDGIDRRYPSKPTAFSSNDDSDEFCHHPQSEYRAKQKGSSKKKRRGQTKGGPTHAAFEINE